MAPTHTLVIDRDTRNLDRLAKYRTVTEEDIADSHRATIECSDPASCDVWTECPRDDHGDPEDFDYEATVFHGVEHEWLYPAGSWCIPEERCAASVCEWDLPDAIDTEHDGKYPVELEWDDELLIVLLRNEAQS